MNKYLLSNLSYLDENFAEQSGNIGVCGEVIDFIGDGVPNDGREVIDCSGCAAIPAFVNAHAHSPMAFLRGYAENLPLDRWLFEKIFPFEATLTGEDIYNAMLLSFAEMLRFGCVSTNDMYYNFSAMARAVSESFVKSNISLSILESNLSALLPEYDASFADLPNTNGRLVLDTSIHAVYTNTIDSIRVGVELAKKHNTRLHLHLSETVKENEDCVAKYGVSPTRLFESCGAFELPVTAAHCVHLSREDAVFLAEHKATAAVCPASNLKLASGIPNIPMLLDSGVNVALGTDSVASNNNLDMFSDMRLFAALPKAVTGNAAAVSSAQTIYASTRAGAISQGRTDCGLLAKGFKADIAVINMRAPHLTPSFRLADTLVWSALGSDVTMTICDGRILYRKGEYTTIDIEKITAYANERVKK